MKLKIIKALDVVVEYAIYGLLLFVSFSIAGVSIFAGLAVAAFLIKQIIAPDLSALKAHRTLFLLLLVFFVFMALSLLNSGSLIGTSVHALFIKWGRFPLLLWVVLGTFRDTKRIVNAAYVLLSGATLICLSVLSQKFLGYEFLCHRPMVGAIVTGPFKNQNGLAGYLTGVIPLALSLSFWKWKQLSVKVGSILITIMFTLCSLWTLCRGGWIGLISGAFFVVLASYYHRVQKKVFWALFSISAFFLVPATVAALFFFQNRGDSNRLIIFNGAWKMITEHPFLGKGLGTFMAHCAAYTNNFGTYYAHNCFLQIWAESGIFSLLGFLAVMGYVLYKSLKSIMRPPVSFNSFILIGLSAGLFGFLVHSAFETHLYSFQLSFLFWLLLGFTVALSSNLDQEAV